MAPQRISRREVMERCIVRGLLVSGAAMSQTSLLGMWQAAEQAAAKPTPTEVLGPFFKKGAPSSPVLRMPGDHGFPLQVSGKVCNTRGELVPGARVDVWHADHHGKYDLQGYRFRAKVEPAANGLYSVETVMPGHYADRPAQHVHYLITAPGHKSLITQLYFATDPFFEGDLDKNHAKRAIVQDRALIRPVTLHEGQGQAHAAVVFDIVLERA